MPTLHNTMTVASRSTLDIQCVDPLQHADGLKALFAENEREDFAAYFDRAYPEAVRDGARSWIGRDETGTIVLHMARIPQRCTIGGRTVTGGLLVNLMADREHRSLFPALTLVRRLVSDSRADGSVDFLYTDPNTQAAALLRVAGFVPVGDLERLVLPLSTSIWAGRVLVRVFHLLLRLGRRWRQPMALERVPAASVDDENLTHQPSAGTRLRFFRSAASYRRRLAAFPSSDDHWLTLRSKHGTPAASANAMVRAMLDGSAIVCSLSRTAETPLARIVPSLAQGLRRDGHRSIWLWTLAGTHFARELQRAGFIARPDRVPVFGLALNDVGAETLRAVREWEVTHLDFDR